MNELLQTYTFLNQAMHEDSLLCLAHAVVWLDPLWRGYEDDFEHDPDGILNAALVVTRQSFPDLYVDAVDKIRQGASYAAIDQLICEGITAIGIPLDNLEHLPYGIPLPAYGVALDDPEFYSQHADVQNILECFDILPDPNNYHVDVPTSAYTVGQIIADDLQKHFDERYRQVSWLMQWLWSSSGNSSIDLSYEELCEFQPLSWDEDDLAFAHILIEEADEIMAEVLDGLAWLTSEPALMQALQDNIRKIYKAIERQKDKRDIPNVRLKWPDIAISTERAA
jgi:hypothetical protein